MHKLLYIITRTELGGAQRHLYELINHFKSRYQISLICGEKDWLYFEANKIGIETVCIKNLVRRSSPINDYKAYKKIIQCIETKQIDLIHVHSTKAAIIGRLAANRCNVRVIFTVHGWGFHPAIPLIRRYGVYLLEKYLGPKTDKIICVSEYDRNISLKYKMVSSDKVVTIYNGLPDTVFLKDANSEKEKFRIVMVARFNEQKDQKSLIKAFQSIEQRIKCELHLVGGGPLLDDVKALASKDKRIIFHGLTLNVEELLVEYDVFILCTHWEGLPISIIEAMRCGLPVLASDTGGNKELLQHCREYLIRNKNYKDIANKLTSLIQDKSVRNYIGRKNREIFLESFTSERMLNKINLEYNSLLKSSRSLPK